MTIKGVRPVGVIMLGTGCLFVLWAGMAMISGLHRVDWQLTEFMRQLFVASGMVQPIHTLVDFYTHIKGIEYIICVAFFVAFPVFFQYVEKKKTHITTSLGSAKNK